MSETLQGRSWEFELLSIFFGVFVHAPFFDHIVNDQRAPDNRVVLLFFRPIRKAPNNDEVVFRLNPVKRVPVVRILLEELLPSLDHRLFRMMGFPLAVDKGVVPGHQVAEPAKVLIVDALI